MRSKAILAARIALLPVGSALAAAALINAASGAEVFFVGPGAYERLGLDAHIQGHLVDQGFAVEIANHPTEAAARGEFPRIPGTLSALARDSFAADPLEVSSLRTIALGSMLQDDQERARSLMRAVVQISRRDAITNLWLAQDYGRLGELDEMLAAFDHALRTSRRTREFAMKSVVEMIASEESYAPLSKLLSEGPEWEEDFWQEFARNPVALAHAANFLERFPAMVGRIPSNARKVLYANLSRTLLLDPLYRIATLDTAARAGSDDLANGLFVTQDQGNPLGWTLRSQGGFATQVQEEAGELQIDARSGAFGIAARRVVRIADDHRVTITMAEQVPDNAEVGLAVHCADGTERKLSDLRLDARESRGEVAFAAGGCEFARIDLSFSVESMRRDALIRIAKVRFD